MIFEFVESVGILSGVNQLANLDDGLVIGGFHETDSIIGWKHGRAVSLSSRRTPVIRLFTIVWREKRIMLPNFQIAMLPGMT